MNIKQAKEMSCRDTLHPATSLLPGSLMFKHGYLTTLPRVNVDPLQVNEARLRDQRQKRERQLSHLNFAKKT